MSHPLPRTLHSLRLLPWIALITVRLAAQDAAAMSETATSWTAKIQNLVRVSPNITYLRANNVELKLDVYRSSSNKAAPTVIYIHGGGWVGGSKESSILRVLPYLERGWAAVNVQYRLAEVSLAPAAVEDCLCALSWVARNAEEYGFDPDRIVVTGNSAGGHLSLTTGMIPESAGLARRCPSRGPAPKVAAVVNWYGITDVADLLGGENERSYAVTWLGSQTNREETAKRVSPVAYVSKETPPILTVHGDADPVVPYSQAQALHAALDAAGIPNQLITVEGGSHGRFPNERMPEIYDAIFRFLEDHAR